MSSDAVHLKAKDMASLPNVGAGAGADTEKTATWSSERSYSHTRQTPSGGTWKLLFAALSLALSGYFFYGSLSPHSQHAALADSYALCSREGDQIYTVDPDEPRAQCLVVHGGKFASTGSLGASTTCGRPSRTCSFNGTRRACSIGLAEYVLWITPGSVSRARPHRSSWNEWSVVVYSIKLLHM